VTCQGWSGELSTRSEAFGTRRAAHDVRFHDTGIKRFHHLIVDAPVLASTMKLSADT
jgi:hypothetical protein